MTEGAEDSTASDTEDVILRATVERVTFRNPDNGYSVIQVTIEESGERLAVVGNSSDIDIGSYLVLRGNYVDHPRFGRQFAAAAITPTVPTTESGLERYLASGLIKGIGEKTAERVIDALGTDAVRFIREDVERVAAIPGVGRRRAEVLQSALREQDQQAEIRRFLVEQGISPHLAHKIQTMYGEQTIEFVTKDPYRLAREIYGIGFATADQIGLRLGLREDSPQRLQAGILYALEKGTDEGHAFLPGDILAQRARALLGIDGERDLTPPLQTLLGDRFIIEDEGSYYLPTLHRAEEFLARFIAGRAAPFPSPLLPPESVDEALDHASSDLGVRFSIEQREAIHAATSHPLLIITGGPGCGKTTIIRALAHLFRKAEKRLLLAAPTGRAAQRMAQVCEMGASTIHRLLRYDPLRRNFLFGPRQPLPADVVVIDESSMIDLPLAMHLCSAIAPETTLVLVGDRDQLPSVGPGRFFADLVGAPGIKTAALQRIFRREGNSSINTVAHTINAGGIPEIPQPDGETKTDAYFLPRSEPEEAADLIEKLVSDQLPKKFGFAPHEISVLSPTNRGPLGVEQLNLRLQSRLNPESLGRPGVHVGSLSLRIGDRICQLVNNYNLGDVGVFNGDVGTVYGIDESRGELTAELWDGRLITYRRGDMHQLALAYALTVHRSQGSEMPCVVLALHDSHYALLERQLVYTAVTRAKKLLVIVGSKRALAIACRRTNTQRRLSRLRERVMRILGDTEPEPTFES